MRTNRILSILALVLAILSLIIRIGARAMACQAEPTNTSQVVEVDAVDFYVNGFNRYLDADGQVRWCLHDVIDQETTDQIAKEANWSDLQDVAITSIEHGVNPSRFLHYYLDSFIDAARVRIENERNVQ